MKVRHSTNPLPRSFRGHPHGGAVLAEHDIRLTRGSRLAAKLLVFKNSRELTEFWRNALGSRMSPGALGAVNALAREVGPHDSDAPTHIECDPRYFCVIGLTRGALSMECITHESVHAGFCFAKRHRRDFWVKQSEDFCEEDVCYPAGRIAKRINAFLHDGGWYQ